MGFITLSVVVKRDVATDGEGDQEHVSQNDRDVDGSVPEFQGFVLHCIEEQKWVVVGDGSYEGEPSKN